MAEEKDKEEIQETQTPETETPEVEPVVEPQVSTEDLQKEVERKEGEIQRLQGITKDLQKKGISGEVLDSFGKRMGGLEEQQAVIMDMLEERLGEPSVEETKTRKTHLEQLREGRTEAQKGRETTVPPDVQRFFSYCDSADLHVDYDTLENCDPLIKEALGEGRGFKEGLKYLKEKVKGKNEEKTNKQFEQMRQEVREQTLKEHGLTASDAGGPSAPAQSWRDLSADEKLRRAMAGKNK